MLVLIKFSINMTHQTWSSVRGSILQFRVINVACDTCQFSYNSRFIRIGRLTTTPTETGYSVIHASYVNLKHFCTNFSVQYLTNFYLNFYSPDKINVNPDFIKSNYLTTFIYLFINLFMYLFIYYANYRPI
jgi:hypothetical protein